MVSIGNDCSVTIHILRKNAAMDKWMHISHVRSHRSHVHVDSSICLHAYNRWISEHLHMKTFTHLHAHVQAGHSHRQMLQKHTSEDLVRGINIPHNIYRCTCCFHCLDVIDLVCGMYFACEAGRYMLHLLMCLLI
jgi:hypothetical protein